MKFRNVKSRVRQIKCGAPLKYFGVPRCAWHTLHYVYGEIFALFAGALLVLAFAPFNLWPFSILAPALLLAVWLPVSPKRAFLRGWLFGLGMYGAGIYWVYISLRIYGYSSAFFAGLATALLIAAFALYPAVQGYLFNRLFPKNNWSKCLLVFPASWAFLEWIRSWLFTGFPWLSLGYTQTDTRLHGIASLFGVYGVSFIVAFMSALLVAIFYFKPLRWRITSLVSILAIWVAASAFTHVNWTHPLPEKLKVSLLQGNIPQEQKWQQGNVQTILQTYLQLTEKNWHSDLIIWPECAIVLPNVDAKDYLNYLNQSAKNENAAVISGIPIYQNFQYYNGVMVLGNGTGTYLKRHLLPFGDYIPLRFIFDIFSKFVQIPMSDFSHGPAHQPNLIAHNTTIAPFICYEIVFPEEVIKSLPKAQLLLLVTDDSWFGKSIAAAQHLQMAQMRAEETGRYLLFDANSGITAIVNPQGKILAIAPMFKTYVLDGSVQPMVGSTPYIMWGNYPMIAGCIGLLGIGWIRNRKSK